MDQCSVENVNSSNRLGKRKMDRSLVDNKAKLGGGGHFESLDANNGKHKAASAYGLHDRDDVHSLSCNTGSNMNSFKKPYPTLNLKGPALFKVEKDPARLIEKEINLLNSQLKCQQSQKPDQCNSMMQSHDEDNQQVLQLKLMDD